MSLQTQLCTLCGVFKSQVKCLYSDESVSFGTLSKINELFKPILCIPSYQDDLRYICSNCEFSVHHFYKFWEMVQKVQKNLSFHQQREKSNNSLFIREQMDSKNNDNGLNLCHTTGITIDSQPVLIKINIVKQIQCDICKIGLSMSQLIALHQVTHGLGTVLCQCEQCGHQDDIGSFLQEKNNVHCPQCSFRKPNLVNVQTQFIRDEIGHKPLAVSYSVNGNNSTEGDKNCLKQNPESIDSKMKKFIPNDISHPYGLEEKYGTNLEPIQTESSGSRVQSGFSIDKYKVVIPNQTSPESSSSTTQVRNDLSAGETVHIKSQAKTAKRHVCDICSRDFNHKGHLKRHMLVHDKSVQHFLCHECGRKFNQKSSLQTHWTHLHCKDKGMDNQFQCVWCGQVYKHKMNLRSHLMANHNKNAMLKSKFFCSICNKYFISKSRLYGHSKVHISMKEFKCQVCEKTFSQRNNLNVHRKKHGHTD